MKRSIPRSDATEVVDLFELELPAWVNQFYQDLTNVTENKIDERLNESQDKPHKRLVKASLSIKSKS